jgi:Leucine-rich repeat (LRR) protein
MAAYTVKNTLPSRLSALRELDLSICENLVDITPLLALENLEKLETYSSGIEEIPAELAYAVEDYQEPEDDEEESDPGASHEPNRTVVGLHMGVIDEWVMASLGVDDDGWLDDISISTDNIGSGDLVQKINARLVVTDAPFKAHEELSTAGEERLEAVAGAEKWAKRYVVRPFSEEVFKVAASSGGDLSTLSAQLPRKSIDAFFFAEELREMSPKSSSKLHVSVGEIALLALGEKRNKFATQKSSLKGSQERATVLEKRLRKEPEFSEFDLWNYLCEVKDTLDVEIPDVIDAIALGLVAMDWLTYEDSRLAISDSSGRVRPWDGKSKCYYAIPEVSKKQPPK